LPALIATGGSLHSPTSDKTNLSQNHHGMRLILKPEAYKGHDSDR
jgi:hypothetical protein